MIRGHEPLLPRSPLRLRGHCTEAGVRAKRVAVDGFAGILKSRGF